MKISLLFGTAMVFLLFACNDAPAKKRTFSARTEAVSTPDSSAALTQPDTIIVNQNLEDQKLETTIKLKIMDVDSTGGTIDFSENGNLYKHIFSKGIEYPVELKLNTYYLVKCSKKGYVTKVVYFDTHIPAGRQKEEFALFKMEVELHKETKGEKTNTDKPVGGIKYDPVSGDFNKAPK